jgi:peroxiredoxin
MSAPPFHLRTPFGVEVSLTAACLEGPVLVEFIRGTWDPDARRRLAELASAKEAFRERKVRVLVVSRERTSAAAGYLTDHPSPLTVLIDEDGATARSYGVFRRFSLPVWSVARPSSFLVDRCGFLRYVYVAALPIHAAPVQEILAATEAA